MFVMTMKFTKRKAVFLVIAAAVIIAAIVLIAAGGGTPQNARGFDSNDGRLEYLLSLGWECAAEPLESSSVIIPKEFDSVFETYNKLQKQQGFDLSKYAGLEVMLYTYQVTNYPSNENVVAQLFVYGSLLIGGDIHSTSLDGFMHGLK